MLFLLELMSHIFLFQLFGCFDVLDVLICDGLEYFYELRPPKYDLTVSLLLLLITIYDVQFVE